jgi:murein DD-endopeptidase MepM/ murein hydrolase activator NlpD
MRRLVSLLKRYGPILPVVGVIVLIVGVLTYLAGTLGVFTSNVRIIATPLNITTVPPLPGTPVAPFSQLDPAIVEYLDRGQPRYGVVPLDALGVDVQPVGAYLPASGNMSFGLAPPTALPTPLPFPTIPPLPLPTFVGQEDVTPGATNIPGVADDGTPRTLPYGGDSCAPAGLPVNGILSQRFHYYHSGIDLAVPLGTPVVATHSGKVTFAGWNKIGYGYLVTISNGVFTTYYAHNTSFNVSADQFVGKGSIIAWAGSTGNSTGPHVHYETRINDRAVDPLTFERRGYKSC